MDVAFSLNHSEFYDALINEGVRAQLLRTLLEQQDAEEEATEDESDQEPKSTAADLQSYLKSKLVFEGEGHREVCLDARVHLIIPPFLS